MWRWRCCGCSDSRFRHRVRRGGAAAIERHGVHRSDARRFRFERDPAGMPTPAEQRALLLLASVATLGVVLRTWGDPSARAGDAAQGDRAGLARQIRLVDSAIARGGRKASRPKAAAAGQGDSSGMPTPSTAPRERRPRRSSARPAEPLPTPSPDNRDAYRRLRAEQDSLRRSIARSSRRRAREEDGEYASSERARRVVDSRSRGPVDLDVATAEEIATLPAIGEALARRIVGDRVAHGPFGSLDELRRVRGISTALTRRIAGVVTFSREPVTSNDPSAAGSPERAPLRSRTRRPSP